MKQITRNYIYNLLYQLFIMFIPIITAPYLARTLGATNQGIASYITSVASIISTVTLLGVYNYGNRQIAYERDNRPKMSQIFWEIMSVRVILGLVGTIIYFFVVAIIGRYTQYFIIYYTWLLASYCDCTWLYVGVEDMKPAVIKNFFAKLITIIGIFILIKKKEDIFIYVLILGLSVLISNMWAYTQLFNYIDKPKINRKNIFQHIKSSFILFLPSVATLVYLQIDKIMIEFITRQTSQVAFYDNSEKIVTIPLSFITVLSTVMMPRIANEFSKGNTNNIRKYILKIADISLFLALPMTFGLILISSKFVPWYLGDEFTPIIYGIIFLSPVIISNSLEGISGKQYFTATNQVKILLKAYTSTAIMNVLINIILIPKYGFIGATIATLISSYTSVIVQYYYLNKQINIKPIIKNILKYFIMSSFMTIITLLLTINMPSSALTTIFQVLIGIVIYLLLCILSKDKVLFDIFSIVKGRF